MHPSSGSSVARAKPTTAEMDPIRVERTRALHRHNDAMATPSRPVAEGSTKPVNPSFAKPSSESTSCDNAPLRVPRRRPSADEESTLHSASLLSDDDDDDDDATQVTSNTNPHLHVEEHPTTSSSSSEEKDGEEKDEHHTVATCHLTDQGSATSKQTETDLVVVGHANNPHTAPTCPRRQQRHDEEEEEVVQAPVILVPNPTSPPDITCTTTNIATAEEEEDPNKIPLLTKERIRSFITDYYEDFDSIFQKNGSNKQLQKECFEAFFDQYYTEDVLWIRSSGNPIGRKDLAGMLTDHIDVEHALLVSIDHICLLAGGQVATVVYTADLLFSFQGKPQSDRTVLSSVVQLDGVEPKIAHVHWSVGQPIPKASRWET